MSYIGQKFGPFEIIERTQIPEMGDWYLGRRMGQTIRQPHWVYIRILPAEAGANDKARLQLDYEGLRMLEDGRIPGAVGYYKDQGALAIHTTAGAPLRHLVEGRKDNTYPMTPATLLDIVVEVCEVLEHAHDRQRHHGHLSDESVWLSADGQIHVFGFASPAAAPRDVWLSPERSQARPHGASTDQWSVGALIAALITGRAPWSRNKDRASVDERDIEAMVVPVETQWPALGRTVRRMLSVKPADRFPSMSAARAELLKLSRRAGGASERKALSAMLIDRIKQATSDEKGPESEIDPPSSFDALGTEPPTAPTTIDSVRAAEMNEPATQIDVSVVEPKPETVVVETRAEPFGAADTSVAVPSTPATPVPPPPPPLASSLPSTQASRPVVEPDPTPPPTVPTDPGPNIDPDSRPPAIGVASVAQHEKLQQAISAPRDPQQDMVVVAPRFSDDVSIPDAPPSEPGVSSLPLPEPPSSPSEPKPPSSPGVAEVLMIDTDPNSSPALSLSATNPGLGPTGAPTSWDASLGGPTGAMASGAPSLEMTFDDATELDGDIAVSGPKAALNPRKLAPTMVGLMGLSLLIWALVQAC